MPADISPALQSACEQILGCSIRQTVLVGGGDINEARLLHTDQGEFFLKFNHRPEARDMFLAEARGLELLSAAGQVTTPGIIGRGAAGPSTAFLLLSYIPSAPTTHSFWQTFGRQLAALHRSSQDQFGLPHDNFIGRLPQSNTLHKDWIEFYIDERLQPQWSMARNSHLLTQRDESNYQQLLAALPGLLSPEAPALIHGDLWSGNFLCNPTGEPVLIDPAACFAHREMDLAMSHLFGGFAAAFYQAYEEAYPTPPGLNDRLLLYQLYYLLVHVNLFGGSYAQSVRSILRKFN